ncbi:hypothetical protein HOY82DRAFT_621672 [Tuber indicum]|nr:hypothetical protein HOY82DRAFT_621672 [Tuber indicum]
MRNTGYTIPNMLGKTMSQFPFPPSSKVLTVWGRLNSGQLGPDPETLMGKNVVPSTSRKPRYLSTPHVVASAKLHSISCSTYHNIATSRENRARSWGFSCRYQTGLGPGAGGEIRFPTEIEIIATRGIKVVCSHPSGPIFHPSRNSPQNIPMSLYWPYANVEFGGEGLWRAFVD